MGVKTFIKTGIWVRHIRNMLPISFGVSDKEVAITIEKMEGGKMSQSFSISNDPYFSGHGIPEDEDNYFLSAESDILKTFPGCVFR